MSQKLSKEQLIKIADEFGTPVYVYHAERISEQYDKLKNAFVNNDYVIYGVHRLIIMQFNFISLLLLKIQNLFSSTI